jgi:hypothetical protein
MTNHWPRVLAALDNLREECLNCVHATTVATDEACPCLDCTADHSRFELVEVA